MSKGKIFLVGLGPGAANQMSGRARQAIAVSEVVVGYAKYLDLVEDLLGGKEVIRKGMTQEVDRCVAACEQARRGKRVALVSSGDIGVYGMAGLTYEVLFQSGWTPPAATSDGTDNEISVEVVPGITALSACASLAGAPLSHDFCAISLSDPLTPWPVIARRLEAAARGDFVVALYNPRSGRRRGQLVEAKNILLRQRQPDTPVAVVNAAYRETQATQLSTLDEMLDRDIGMLSTVLVGNSSTYWRSGLMITPRGYSHKYGGLTGDIKEGEKSGRSLSMGLDGWKACVRRYLRAAQNPLLADVARHFDVSLGEILSAIAAADDGERAGNYSALTVALGKEAEILSEARSWGRIRVALNCGTGATCELLMDAQDLALRGDRLRAKTAEYRLEVDWSRVRQGCFLSRGEQLRGVQFVDAAGDLIFALSLERDGGGFEPDALGRYKQASQRMAVSKTADA